MATSKVIGAFEPIDFPEFGITGMKAKIDTGAYTGALHCTQISETDKVLRFSPFDHPEIIIEEDDFVVRHVRSSNGAREKRYFITTQIMVQGKTYPVILSLADRSEMKWPVLIGRRFLRQNNFLVDVRKRTQYREQVQE
jgi:hypothetical protein